jgi:hypothetical protein
MTSAIARLRALPEAFTLAGFRKFTGLSGNAAAVCLHRWKVNGLIETAGDRVGIYFNKLKCPTVDGALRIDALLFEYPTAILCGESVLHAAGWITQIPTRLAVAVLSRPSYASLHKFELHGRPLAWFKKVHVAVTAANKARVYGLKALPPALALADLYGEPRAWHPDVDDLTIPADERGSVLSAFTLLAIDLPAPLLSILHSPPLSAP